MQVNVKDAFETSLSLNEKYSFKDPVK